MFFCGKLLLLLLTILAAFNVNSAADNDKKQEAKCLLPMEPGPCRMNLDRFYYNAKTDTCEEFKFGGCRGNDNKFGFKESCEAACKKSTSTTSAGTGTSSTTETPSNPSIQLNVNTLKTLTSKADVSAISSTTTTTTTSKPGTSRTAAVRGKSSTPRSGTNAATTTTTTQKPKRL